jgi:hypothetical protein
MKLYQNPLKEHLLWEHLQREEWDKALEQIDWYYSRSNPNGFDDPQGIRNASFLSPNSEFDKKNEPPVRILRSQETYRSLLYILGFVYACFGFLSYKAETIYGIIVPAILFPIIPLAIYNLIKKTTEIVLTDEYLGFRKSTKNPIFWKKILVIYFYHRGTGGINYPGYQESDFIFIWKKDSVKPEIYYLNNMEFEPKDIVYLIHQHWMKKTKLTNIDQAYMH